MRLNLLKPHAIGYKRPGMSRANWWIRVTVVGGAFYVAAVRPTERKAE